mmetsp:Transcript_15606/g.43126  ORF Transcript_15606/g.43126 Transcript_15606/m.43126 type:complete len:230 (+) Transcript_15606:445-1134(+)
MTMKMLHFPTICIAVAPICCTTQRPTTLSAPAARTFVATPSSSKGCSAGVTAAGACAWRPMAASDPRHRAAQGAESPAGSKAARRSNAKVIAGVWSRSSCIGARTGSATSSRPRPSARTPRSMTTVFSARKSIAPKLSATPRALCGAMDDAAAASPPWTVMHPPMMARPMASQARLGRRAPRRAERTPVHAGVMLPSTAFRPGSIRPSEALFAATETEIAKTTGITFLA